MFRARFASAFPRFVSNFGPQDLENAIVGKPPGDLAEKLLCALLGLVLNRKKDVVYVGYCYATTGMRGSVPGIMTDH